VKFRGISAARMSGRKIPRNPAYFGDFGTGYISVNNVKLYIIKIRNTTMFMVLFIPNPS
jgi:hypothetical protein